MRAFFLIACVSAFPVLASASEVQVRAGRSRVAPSLRLIDLAGGLAGEPSHAPLGHALEAPKPLASDALLRYDDATSHAEHTVISALENAQHLGNPYRTWLWVTPLFGSVNGAALRFDLR